MLARPTPASTSMLPIPAPLGGINALESIMRLPPEDAVMAVNFVASTYGLKVRDGYEEFARGFDGDSTQVRTIIPYPATDPSNDQLFAATQEGIYDVTTGTPAVEVNFGTTTGNAGFCSYAIYTGLSTKYLFVCDEENGCYRYDGTTWVKLAYPAASAYDIEEDAGLTVSADPTKFVFVTVWKNRLWFIEKNSSYAWFLPVGAVQTGAAPAAGAGAQYINFGNKFIQGGFLSTLHSYTLEGGVGIDDYLVAISSVGDMLVYRGTDPTDVPASFGLVGSWKIGKVPVGRRYAAESGGDLYILSSYGVASVAQTLKGVDPGTKPAYITGKISRLVARDLATLLDTRGWELINHPAKEVLILTVPSTSSTETYKQYVMNTSTRSWTKWTDVPILSAAVYDNTLYFGSRARADAFGSVYTLSGDMDDVRSDYDGLPISWFLLTSYQYGREAGNFSRIHFVKPQFLVQGTPLYKVEIRYDFDIDDTIDVLAGDPVVVAGSTWGSSTWANAIWGGEVTEPLLDTRGGSGMGQSMAIALTGKSRYETTLLGFLAMYDQGGML